MKKALMMISVLGLSSVQAQADTTTEVQMTPELEAKAKMLVGSDTLDDHKSVEAKIKLMESLMSRTNAKDDSLNGLILDMTAKEVKKQKTTKKSSTTRVSAKKTRFNKSSRKATSRRLSHKARPAVAARRASRTAHSRSRGLCARYVRKALQAAGYKFSPNGSAYQYASRGTLRKAGFTKISNRSRAQVGDVVVISRSRAHPHGHIAIYDGRNWVSDFRQNRKSPYRRYYPYTTWRDSRYLNNASSKGLYMANR